MPCAHELCQDELTLRHKSCDFASNIIKCTLCDLQAAHKTHVKGLKASFLEDDREARRRPVLVALYKAFITYIQKGIQDARDSPLKVMDPLRSKQKRHQRGDCNKADQRYYHIIEHMLLN